MKILHEVMTDITHLGSLPHFGIYALLAFVFSVSLGMQVLLLSVISLIVVALVRLLYFKHRPEKQAYRTLLERLDASSFPSLHAARSSGLVVVAYAFYPLLGFIVLPVCLLVISSRIYLRKHDWIDVSAGAILGLALGALAIYGTRLLLTGFQ